MPWESASRPSLATGTLCALARRAGHACSAQYLNLDLAADLGPTRYAAFSENLDLFPLGEHLFACDLFGPDALDSEEYLARFGGAEGADGEPVDILHELRDRRVPDFLEAAAEQVLREGPDVVGFTCTFNQVLASLALARRLKAASPGTTVLLGGASVHGPMGRAYAEAFGTSLVDHVFTGEADHSFLAWLDAFAAGEPHRPIPGVTGNHDDVAAPLVTDLDALPVPDFGDYFHRRAQIEDGGRELQPVRHLPYESSRGCWWGQRHHCTFCGLNNEGMSFRRKSPTRVVDELEELASRHGVTSFMAADNILDFHAYRDLLVSLAASPVDYDLFYEIKANVRRAEVATLRAAGVWRVQPGIESFSDHVLTLMRKGVTALQNVQLLKWAHEHGMTVEYNVLVGFPGETASDYDQVVRVMRAIPHLPPPNGRATVVRVDRFSPFHDQAEALGIRGLRAAEHYRHLVPTDRLAPERHAYFFDRDLDDLAALQDKVDEVDATITAWKSGDDDRRARLGPDFVEVLGYHAGRLTRHPLRGAAAKVFVLADAVVARTEILHRLGTAHPEAEVSAAIDDLVDRGILLASDGRVVGVVPFSVPHAAADLRGWLASQDVPDGHSPEPRPARGDTPDGALPVLSGPGLLEAR